MLLQLGTHPMHICASQSIMCSASKQVLALISEAPIFVLLAAPGMLSITCQLRVAKVLFAAGSLSLFVRAMQTPAYENNGSLAVLS